MIGGAATSELWSREMGTDAWASTAVAAVKNAKELMRSE